MTAENNEVTNQLLERIADALERLAPPTSQPLDLDQADAFIWHAESEQLEPVERVNRIAFGLLQGIDRRPDDEDESAPEILRDPLQPGSGGRQPAHRGPWTRTTRRRSEMGRLGAGPGPPL